jgi:hypothetical protein
MWGWIAPGSRGQLPTDKPDDEATQRSGEQHRGRRASAPSVIALVVLVVVVVTLAALFAFHLT